MQDNEADSVTNGWNVWANHILAEIKRSNDDRDDLRECINKINIEIAMLKVKSGVWGILGGFVPVLIALLIMWLK